MEIIITSDGGGESYSGAIEYNDCYGVLTGRLFLNPGTYYQCVENIGGLDQIQITFGTGTLSPISNCSGSCPPAVTPTQTSSNTPTPTPSSTIGTTPPNTPTPTPTPTFQVTSTPTNTQTPTPTFQVTSTPTNTQTPTPTSGVSCVCYWFINETGTGGDITFQPCGDVSPATQPLGAGQQIRVCTDSSYTPTTDPNITVTNCGDPCTDDGDCVGCV